MNDSIIIFSTQTLASRAQQLLRSNGIAAVLRRNTNPDPKEGCSFALYVRTDPAEARRLLHRAGLNFRTDVTGREAK